jgi:hypothetical protein
VRSAGCSDRLDCRRGDGQSRRSSSSRRLAMLRGASDSDWLVCQFCKKALALETLVPRRLRTTGILELEDGEVARLP